MDITALLRGLGLEQYEQAFRDHSIDAEILPKLTAEDLNDMGIAAVGHRRRCWRPSAPCVPAHQPMPSPLRWRPRRWRSRKAIGGR